MANCMVIHLHRDIPHAACANILFGACSPLVFLVSYGRAERGKQLIVKEWLG